MQCLTEISSGVFSVASPQPTEYSSCVYLIAQPNELPTAFMNMTVDEGLQVGGLLALVLVAGFTIRAIARALSAGDNSGDSNA